jgi:hypothetical protein
MTSVMTRGLGSLARRRIGSGTLTTAARFTGKRRPDSGGGFDGDIRHDGFCGGSR